jgi:lipoprotein-anchoring transpeptidase ErfK/SrfK
MISMRSIRLALCFAVAFVGMVSAANAAVLITIDKSAQRMTVAVDGAVRWTWPVSTGSRGYDTPTGSYTAFRMEKDHFSREWDDAPMPHSIFFTKRGHAIHGSYETKRLGRPVSHGCVRLSPGNAAKLYALVQSEGVSNATVVVAGAVGGRR